MGFSLPIAWKLVLMTVVVLVLAAVPAAWKINQDFQQLTRKREAAAIAMLANTRARELDATLETLVSRVRSMAGLLLRRIDAGTGNGAGHDLGRLFREDPELISLRILTRKGKGEGELIRMVRQDYLKARGLGTGWLDRLDQRRPFPVKAVFQGKTWLRNRSLRGGAPLFSIGFPLRRDNTGRVTHMGLADVRLFTLQKGFSSRHSRRAFLVDAGGMLLADADENRSVNPRSMNSHPAVSRALDSKVSQGLVQYRGGREGRGTRQQAAFARSRFGLAVIASGPAVQVAATARVLGERVLQISAFTLSAALLLVLFFAGTLTRPLERLGVVAGKFARGDFRISARAAVPAGDEAGQLALAMDRMAEAWQQRDRLNQVFHKLRGPGRTGGGPASGVPPEGRPAEGALLRLQMIPDQVPAAAAGQLGLLNTFLAMAVPVISRHHGVVERFTSDGLVAVFGLPRSTGHDEWSCVMAALECRRELEGLNRNLAAGEPVDGEQADGEQGSRLHLRMRMRGHCGDLLAGVVGVRSRMEYSILGHGMDELDRLVAGTGDDPADLLISDRLATRIRDRFVLAAGAKPSVYTVQGYLDEGGVAVIINGESPEPGEAPQAG